MTDVRQRSGSIGELRTAWAGAFTRPVMKRTATSWPHYACDWSQNSSAFCTLAVGSLLPARHNHIQVLSLADRASDTFTATEPLVVEYVPTKVLWSPSKVKNGEYLAASGDGVYIWKVSPDGHGHQQSSFTLTGRLVSRQAPRRPTDAAQSGGEGGNPPAPVTSFDWSRLDPTLLVTASYDTTCTVWCLETGAIKTQLIAHDKEVFDVSFSPISMDTFVSVGADGSLRLFDVRTLDHSTIVYESADARPLLRVQWNPLDANYLSTFAVDSGKAVVMDIRMPSVPAAELSEHDGPVVAMRWSPTSSAHLMTADEGSLRLWDLAEHDSSSAPKWHLDGAEAMSRVEATAIGADAIGAGAMGVGPMGAGAMMTDSITTDSMPIQQILWPATAPDWIGVTSPDQISILRL